MRTLLLSFAIVGLLCGCSSKSNYGEARGIVCDATMNTVTIVTDDNDTLSFSTVDTDKSGGDGLLLGDTAEITYRGKYEKGMGALKMVSYPQRALLGGDRDGHGCIGSAGYVWSEVSQDCIRVFEKGIRTESVRGDNRSVYIVFSPDSSQVELFFSDGQPNEILERRTLPSGGFAWNVEDDDTKNVRFINGLWTIEQRGEVIYREDSAAADSSLGDWQERTYEGVLPAADTPGIRYTLTVRNREYSGDGTFVLAMTYLEAENGKDETVTYTGRRFTQRGSADDKDAVVWQLVADDGTVFNFLYVKRPSVMQCQIAVIRPDICSCKSFFELFFKLNRGIFYTNVANGTSTKYNRNLRCFLFDDLCETNKEITDLLIRKTLVMGKPIATTFVIDTKTHSAKRF